MRREDDDVKDGRNSTKKFLYVHRIWTLKNLGQRVHSLLHPFGGVAPSFLQTPFLKSAEQLCVCESHQLSSFLSLHRCVFLAGGNHLCSNFSNGMFLGRLLTNTSAKINADWSLLTVSRKPLIISFCKKKQSD